MTIKKGGELLCTCSKVQLGGVKLGLSPGLFKKLSELENK